MHVCNVFRLTYRVVKHSKNGQETAVFEVLAAQGHCREPPAARRCTGTPTTAHLPKVTLSHAPTTAPGFNPASETLSLTAQASPGIFAPLQVHTLANLLLVIAGPLCIHAAVTPIRTDSFQALAAALHHFNAAAKTMSDAVSSVLGFTLDDGPAGIGGAVLPQLLTGGHNSPVCSQSLARAA